LARTAVRLSPDAHCGRHRVPGYTDRGATEELGRKLKKLAALAAVGQPPAPELADWLKDIPHGLRANLRKWGMINAAVGSLSVPLAGHLDEYVPFKNEQLAEARMADQIGAPGSDGPGQSSGN
jgi:hypothetical protein